jgi:hypothetical protein
VLRLGDELASRGAIGQTGDVFFLTRAELESALSGMPLASPQAVRGRRERWERQRRLIAPLQLGTAPALGPQGLRKGNRGRMPRTQCFAEKRGKTWRGRYADADGRMRSTSGYPTKKEALKAARNARAAVEAGKWRHPKQAEITLADWITAIWPTWDIELTTRANYSAPIRRFILPAFGDRKLKSIRREEIDRWERTLIDEHGYSVEYIRGADAACIPSSPTRSQPAISP